MGFFRDRGINAIKRHQEKMTKYLYTDFARFEVVDEPNPIIDEIFKEVN